MQNGTPSVMTSIAEEGKFGDLEPNGCVTDNPEVFAEKAIALYSAAEIWKNKKQYGFEVICKRFNTIYFESDFATRIEVLSMNLSQHRQTNFMEQVY